MEWPTSAWPRRRVLLVLAFVLLAQFLAFDHLIGHSARGDNAGCAICISASHAGNALPASAPVIAIPDLPSRPELPSSTGQVAQSAPAVYRSRAPPFIA